MQHPGGCASQQRTRREYRTLQYDPAMNMFNPAQSLQVNAITVFGPRLHNPLSKYLTDIQSVKTEKFKFELDKFLDTIPDQPKMPNYVTASGSNSILDQLTHLRAQGIYHSGGVPPPLPPSIYHSGGVLAASKPLQVSKYVWPPLLTCV